jgi:surfactin synthase thioesterase subunit
MSYKNYKWGELSSDFNSPFFRNYIWVNNYYNFPKKFKLSRPIMGIYAEGNQMKYVGDISTWKKTHEEFK